VNSLFIIVLIFYDGIHIIILNVLNLFFLKEIIRFLLFQRHNMLCLHYTNVLYFYIFMVVFFVYVILLD